MTAGRVAASICVQDDCVAARHSRNKIGARCACYRCPAGAVEPLISRARCVAMQHTTRPYRHRGIYRNRPDNHRVFAGAAIAVGECKEIGSRQQCGTGCGTSAVARPAIGIRRAAAGSLYRRRAACAVAAGGDSGYGCMQWRRGCNHHRVLRNASLYIRHGKAVAARCKTGFEGGIPAALPCIGIGSGAAGDRCRGRSARCVGAAGRLGKSGEQFIRLSNANGIRNRAAISAGDGYGKPTAGRPL